MYIGLSKCRVYLKWNCFLGLHQKSEPFQRRRRLPSLRRALRVLRALHGSLNGLRLNAQQRPGIHSSVVLLFECHERSGSLWVSVTSALVYVTCARPTSMEIDIM